MLYQLSYSPRKFGDLAALALGYSYTVPTEADVYPNCNRLASTCHAKPSSGLVTCFIVLAAGCWRSAPPAPLANSPPPASDPSPRIAEFGVFDDPRGVPIPDGASDTRWRYQTFRPTNVVYIRDGAPFGWRIRLPCEPGDTEPSLPPPNIAPRKPARLVEFREVMLLPARGDWDALVADQAQRQATTTEISADGKIATTVDRRPCLDGWIFQVWTFSPHDPPGPWQITVAIRGYATTPFRAMFVAAPAPATAPPAPPPPPPTP